MCIATGSKEHGVFWNNVSQIFCRETLKYDLKSAYNLAHKFLSERPSFCYVGTYVSDYAASRPWRSYA